MQLSISHGQQTAEDEVPIPLEGRYKCWSRSFIGRIRNTRLTVYIHHLDEFPSLGLQFKESETWPAILVTKTDTHLSLSTESILVLNLFVSLPVPQYYSKRTKGCSILTLGMCSALLQSVTAPRGYCEVSAFLELPGTNWW
jgi:hypothetical protein